MLKSGHPCSIDDDNNLCKYSLDLDSQFEIVIVPHILIKYTHLDIWYIPNVPFCE